MKASYSYDPYGQTLKHEGEDTAYRYSGKHGIQTDQNDLLYMRARYYDPSSKRFLGQDILLGNIQEIQSLNRYAYVQGNPMKYIDPTGLHPFEGGSYEGDSNSYNKRGDILGQKETRDPRKDGKYQSYRTEPYSMQENQEKLRRDLFGIGAACDKIKEGANRWLNSTEPFQPLKSFGYEIRVPKTDELVSNIFATAAGTGFGIVSEIQIPYNSVINDRGFVQFFPKERMYRPYEDYGRGSAIISAVSVGLDIGNTWTEDSGNTNLQRLQKTGIQIVGATGSAVVGFVSGIALTAGGAGATATAGKSLYYAGVAAVVIDGVGAWGIDKLQNIAYDYLEIQ
ncbi:MAG: RHS repeat-associated core domain-containing protein [Peptostreptococcaceae bacterium]|nr:RHS repeat-associated core domain-containing protein [Peptostreptococcaceae bacterium]